MAHGKDSLVGRFAFLLCLSLAAGGLAFWGILALLAPAPTSLAVADQDAHAAQLEEYRAQVERMEARIEELERELERREDENPAPASEDSPATGETPTEVDPAADSAEALDAVLEGFETAVAGRQWKRAFALAGKLRRLLAVDPGAGMPGVLALLLGSPDRAMLRALGGVLKDLDLEDHPELATILAHAFLDAARAARDPGVRAQALEELARFLRKHPEAGGLTGDQAVELAGWIQDPDLGEARASALRLAIQTQASHEAVAEALLGVARSDPDEKMRTRAIGGLRKTGDPRTENLLLDLLATEIDPPVLWEAASAANFLTQSSGRNPDFKVAYRALIHREVPDEARARAAQSLALLATLDGDTSIAGELRYLAGSTADATLATFARAAALQLENGTASIASIAKAWTPYHQTLDRKRYP